MGKAEKNKVDELAVLTVLADAGLRGLRAGEIREKLGGATGSTVSRLIRRLIETGWAQQTDDRYSVGKMIEHAVRRIHQDNATTAEQLAEVQRALEPPAPDDGPRGEEILALRKQEDLLASIKAVDAKLERLLRRDEGQAERSAI